MINVLYSFERGSELEYKCIYHGYVTFSLGCYMVCCSTFVIRPQNIHTDKVALTAIWSTIADWSK